MFEIFTGWKQTLHPGGEHFPLQIAFGQIADDLAVTEHTHGDSDKTYAIGQFGNIKSETRHARIHIGTDQTKQQTQNDHGNRFEQ